MSKGWDNSIYPVKRRSGGNIIIYEMELISLKRMMAVFSPHLVSVL